MVFFSENLLQTKMLEYTIYVQCIKVHIKGQKSSHGVALKLIIIYLKLYWLFSYKLFTLKHTIKQNLYYLKSRSKNQSYTLNDIYNLFKQR